MVNNETQFGKATRCFEFFSGLAPNTQIHWSKKKNEFVLTGGGWTGCDTVAATIYKYSDEQTVAKLKEVAEELFLLLGSAEKDVQHYPSVLNLRSKFTRAVTGSSSFDRFGGLQGLSEKYEQDERNAIQSLILEIDTQIDKTLEVLTSSSPYSEDPADEITHPDISPDFYSDEDWEKRLSIKPEAIAPNYTKYFLYSVTLIYNIASNSLGNGTLTWWNDVSKNEDEKILLGALPLIGSLRDDLAALKEIGIGAVLSVVEPFEIESAGVLGSPVTSEQWKEAGVKHLHISTPDFKPLNFEDINLAVEFLRWNIRQSRSVYVHCKAGKARSALVVICYLIKVHSLTFIQALNFIKEKRPQIHLDEGKLNNAKNFEIWWKKKLQKATYSV